MKEKLNSNFATNLPNQKSITFVIPDVDAFQSGGNIYNKKLIEGLREIGYVPKMWTLEQFQAQKKVGLEGSYFFDTLYFSAMETLFPLKKASVSFFLIVHHLESLYPPKNWTARDYFQKKELPFLQQFDGFLTSSDFTANYLTRQGLFQKKNSGATCY